MARYFITGISGFIGLELTRQLLEAGHEIVGLIHNNLPTELVNSNINLVKGGLDEPEKYKSYLQDCDFIVHLAGNPKFGNGPEYEEQNVLATDILLNVAKSSAGKLKRFIFISTIGALDRNKNDICDRPLLESTEAYPSSDYGKSKLKAEKLVCDSGLPYTILRPSLVIGRKMRFASHVAVFARAALRKAIVSRIKWPGRFSVIHVADLAGSIVFVSQQEATKNNLYFAAGDEIAIGDIMRRANPELTQLNIGLITSVFKRFVRFIPFSLKAMLYPALTASDQRLRELGWTTQVSLNDGLDEVIRREAIRLNITKEPNGWTLITGANSGLGRELAVKLQQMGRKLILVDKDITNLQGLFAGNNNVTSLECDLADWNMTEEVINAKLGQEITKNILELFLCAGFGLRGEIGRLNAASQADIFRVNVLSRLQLAAKFLPMMISNQFGRIIYISSSSAYQPLPFMGTYAASNAAILSLGESLAYENAGNGVEVLTVCPGGMATNFQKSAGVKELEGEKLMTPTEAADIILKSIGKNRIVIMPGFRSFAMSLAARILPRKVSLALWGKLMSVAR